MQLIGEYGDSGNTSMDRKKQAAALVAIDAITSRILVVRGQKVMLDADLAALYGVTTKRLNEQLRRNLDRFPPDFVFQLTVQEVGYLRSQIATSSADPRQRAWGCRTTYTETSVARGELRTVAAMIAPCSVNA